MAQTLPETQSKAQETCDNPSNKRNPRRTMKTAATHVAVTVAVEAKNIPSLFKSMRTVSQETNAKSIDLCVQRPEDATLDVT